MKGLVVLGSTGSVGGPTLGIVGAVPEEFRVVGLAARRSFTALASQVGEFDPKYVSFDGTDGEKAEFSSNGHVMCSMEEMVAFPEVDLVVSATVGDAALGPTIAAIEARKEIVLVNKEAIIMAGPI
ncbi:MAG: 1-deoxy-D-xylulose-5-phosphate reductoisomerase, partial [Chloroflexi bacterium]|nr:1-deoxy-D-xylulose-5-phosphate reductoisomerase [Chloroflexota bacterium]